jgi:hypothetical protein
MNASEAIVMTEGDFFEAVRTIIYRRVSAQTDEHFIDRIHLVGVPDAAAEIAAIFRTGQEALSEKSTQTSDTKGLSAVLREWAGNYEEGSFDTEAGLMGEAANRIDALEVDAAAAWDKCEERRLEAARATDTLIHRSSLSAPPAKGNDAMDWTPAQKRLAENLAAFDAEVASELASEGERADLWGEIDVNVEDLRTLLSAFENSVLSIASAALSDAIAVLRKIEAHAPDVGVDEFRAALNDARDLIAKAEGR